MVDWGHGDEARALLAALREESVPLLAEGNEDPWGFRATSRYLVVVAAA